MKKLLIKNMVCDRCITVVRQQIEALGHQISQVELGQVELARPLNASSLKDLESALLGHGFELLKGTDALFFNSDGIRSFELLKGTDAIAVEKVKKLILDHLYRHVQKPNSMNFSDYLAQETTMNYFALSKLFSSTEGITIEKYLILQKIERVKELLVYNQKSLSEIAFELEYSSVAHLSRQFKSVTGLTPSSFRKLGIEGRKSLDKINHKSNEHGRP